jgi:hypothetical protein
VVARLPKWNAGRRSAEPFHQFAAIGVAIQPLAVNRKSGNTLSIKRTGHVAVPKDIMCISKEAKSTCRAS